MELLWYFLAGFFTWNSIPHLVPGIMGQTHMTPFKRVSSPMLNVVWGFINLIIGLYVLGIAAGTGGFALPWDAGLTGSNFWAYLAGAIAVAITAAWLFGRPNARLPWHKD
ncbi:MAG: hypothetical protein UU73_C0003G0143 [Candidatus Daviesbacteria bacterium GW2011_GWA1_41_61]|uniref:Allantoin permease n=1 Tax=Candidatus Daviesbacteria bacterium GW2011_GWA2_40_9 TaxID=1618424 RepID=A0A0G0WFV4_9BACT|nr:MAG: hypothetical protein UU26_C0003G0083 [Candidatus Daviesbacteria bacterium GW2011_GWC1_40_9]KKR83160.1 MAG: hypothetical protein UU29_C0007G0030 [Candidatus Daviesbacteria bacterium GW2011_GWA2_40_9]KKR93507.1 MAG: hypothetical protein UU44_C0002G0168 [Candidatus Daviesbacteria bacterium GW2011_GWB1_41_15]KKS14944.1 MAG: hypothetical protein UU73_C0003G0143 [Candidatus Daviesbacteria bacterium GW2011_GWA1_41_61]